MKNSTPHAASTTWGRRLYFPSEGWHAEDFFAVKIRRFRSGFKTRTRVPEASTLIPRPPKPIPFGVQNQYPTAKTLHTIQVAPFNFNICCTRMIPILWRSKDSFSHSEFKSLVGYIYLSSEQVVSANIFKLLHLQLRHTSRL